MIDKNTEFKSVPVTVPPVQAKHNSLSVIFARRRWSILIITVLFIAAAVLYISKVVPEYTSTARIYVEQTGPKIIGEYEGSMTQSKNYLYTQSELIKSMPIISDVIGQDDIASFKTLSAANISMLENLKNKMGLANRLYGGADSTALFLKEMLDVQVGIKDDIIAVSCTSPFKEEAAEIVNAVIDSYVNYNSTQKKSTVSEVLKILQKEKVQRDAELSQSYDNLLNFTRKHGVASFDKSGDNAVFQRLKNIGDSLTKAQLEVINAQAALTAAEKLSSDPARVKQYAMARARIGSNLFVNDMEVEIKSQMKEIKAELDGVRMQCSDDHPTVVSLVSQIAELQGQLDEQLVKFAESFIDVLRIEYETAETRLAQLEASYEQLQGQGHDLSVRATEFMVLEARLEQNKRFSEILDERIKELNVTEDVGALNISILESARVADIASSPQKAKIVAAALMLGLICGFGFAMSREFMDHRLKGAEEISELLGVPVLGVIPSMGAKGKKASLKFGQKVHYEPKSTIAEAYRTIRTSVFFGVPKAQARTILITSPAPSDGKTTMVSNMAIAMAQAGQKILVIDADFRRPMQHKIFGFKNEVQRGLSTVLAGEIDIASAIRDCPTEGLNLLTSGPEVPNPSELLNGPAFAGLLEKLKETYDRIIIDSPPVMPVADSQILAAICDVTILVLRADKSTRKLGQQARDALMGVGANIFGAVVNDVSKSQSRYGYYSHYGYYGQNHGRKEQ